MHSGTDQAWLDAPPSDAALQNAPLAAKAYVDGGRGSTELPAWVDEVLDGEAPLDVPVDGGTVLARFVRDLAEAIPDETERRRVLRAGLLAAAGRLDDGER